MKNTNKLKESIKNGSSCDEASSSAWTGGTEVYLREWQHRVMLYIGDMRKGIRYFSTANEPEVRENVNEMEKNIEIKEVQLARGVTANVGAVSMITLPKLDLTDPDTISSLSHECLHAALYILRRIGVDIGEHGETLAYTLGYIVQKLLRNFKKGIVWTVKDDGTVVPPPEL